METLVADYVGMINRANELSYRARELSTEIDRLRYVINDIDIFWEGLANEEFQIAMNEDFVVMEALCVKIRYSSGLIKNAVNEYVLAENYISQLIGGL